MIKKYNKILFTTLLFFLLLSCVFITTVSAKEVTLDELAEKVKEIKPDATYVYIIGEYAFTSEHILTTQDTMLAARSIAVSANSGEINSDPIYNEMSMAYLTGTYDNDGNLSGLQYASNIFGGATQKEKYNIKYIDYINAFSKISVNELVNEAYNTINTTAANDKFEVLMVNNKINVTVLDNNMNSIEALKGTGVATAATNLLNEYGIKTVTLTVPGTNTSVEVSADNLMEKLTELNDLFEALAGTTEAKAGDLAGKSIEITLALEEGCTTEDATTFTVAFEKKEIEVAELVDEAYKTINTTAAIDKFEVSKTDDTIKVTVLDNSMNSVEALRGTGVATAAVNLLNEYGIKTVTLVGTQTVVEVSAENLMDKITDLNNLFTELAGTTDSVAGDLAGKSITVKIALEDGCETKDSTTFTVEFGKKVIEVNELVNDAYSTIDTTTANDKFEVSKTNNTISVIVLDNTMNSVSALQGTGVATAATNLLNEYGVKTVTLAIPGTTTSVEVSADSLTEKITELNNLFKTLAGTEDPTTATAGDLAGKSITVTLALEDGCTADGETTFTVAFGKKVIEVNELVEEAYNTINTTATEDKFKVAMADNTINVTVVDTTMNSLEALGGTGIATAATNLLNEYGVKTVTLAIPGTTTSVEVSAENLMDKLTELNDLFKLLGDTAGEFDGKSITVTLALEDGCTAVGATEFTIAFAK